LPEPAGVLVRRPFVGRELPDERERDDEGDHDQAHHRVVEHRVRVERLPALLDVLLVPLVLRPALLEAPRRHYFFAPLETGAMSPEPAGGGGPGCSLPASFGDQGGDVTPTRTTSQRWSPIKAKR